MIGRDIRIGRAPDLARDRDHRNNRRPFRGIEPDFVIGEGGSEPLAERPLPIRKGHDTCTSTDWSRTYRYDDICRAPRECRQSIRKDASRPGTSPIAKFGEYLALLGHGRVSSMARIASSIAGR